MTNSQFDSLVRLIRVVIQDETDKHNFYIKEIDEIRFQLVTEDEPSEVSSDRCLACGVNINDGLYCNKCSNEI